MQEVRPIDLSKVLEREEMQRREDEEAKWSREKGDTGIKAGLGGGGARMEEF